MDTKQLQALIKYSEKFDGVYIRKTTIWLSFNYQGIRCRESLGGIPLTRANILQASKQRSAIEYEIAVGAFDYLKHFPSSPRAKKFSKSVTERKLIKTALNKWLEIKKEETATSTYINYARKTNKYLIPTWGDLFLDELKKTEIEHWIKVQLSHLKNKTKNEILIPLRGILSDALDDELIAKSPMKRIKNLPTEKTIPDPFTQDEIEQIDNTPTDHQSELNAFVFCCWTGLSVSEMMALAWEDVNLSKRTVYVRRARVESEYKCTKEEVRERTIDLLPPAMDVLKRQQLISFMLPAVKYEVIGRDNKTIRKEKFRVVFTRTHTRGFKPKLLGLTSDQQYRERFFETMLRKAGVRYRAPNQARHTFASQLLTAGVPKEWIALQMGHSSTHMIEKHYGKWITEERPDMPSYVSNLMGWTSNNSATDNVPMVGKKSL